ncbi:MAG TPA: hypothetical protein EYP19_07950 [Desulfobacterales bacterium]|nr:hypothetical protein [Desulfobacterales bacterium]
MKKTRSFYFFLLILFVGLTSCVQRAESTPTAWIDYPQDGATFAFGETVSVISHVFAKGGVAEVVLSVNGEAYRRDVPVEAGQEFTDLHQDWIPSEAGIYTLQVRAYNSEGQTGNPASISVEVKGDAPTQAPTFLVTATLVPTGAPTFTPTFVPDMPTSTPTLVPPAPATFTPTSPPPPPADTTPPPVPTPVVPAGGLVLSCRATQNLVWLPVTDPSGILGYYVKLEKEITAGNWQSAGGYGPVADKQLTVNVNCGRRYRWMVRAEDGAGNFSAWSAPSAFAINLE